MEMTALERIENAKFSNPLCLTCVYAKQVATTLACAKSGKLILPQYPKMKCELYDKGESK